MNKMSQTLKDRLPKDAHAAHQPKKMTMPPQVKRDAEDADKEKDEKSPRPKTQK